MPKEIQPKWRLSESRCVPDNSADSGINVGRDAGDKRG